METGADTVSPSPHLVAVLSVSMALVVDLLYNQTDYIGWRSIDRLEDQKLRGFQICQRIIKITSFQTSRGRSARGVALQGTRTSPPVQEIPNPITFEIKLNITDKAYHAFLF